MFSSKKSTVRRHEVSLAKRSFELESDVLEAGGFLFPLACSKIQSEGYLQSTELLVVLVGSTWKGEETWRFVSSKLPLSANAGRDCASCMDARKKESNRI